MVGVNKVILIGNLGKNPEIISFPKEGRRDDSMAAVVRKATFPLATTEIRKNKDGEKIEQTDWHTVVCWRGLADIAEKLLHKGMQIFVEGKLQNRSWEDRDGNKHYATEVVAENFTVLGSRNRNDDTQPTATDPYANILNDETEPMGDLPF
ncbi:MAG: single-stranded DNA-binding protein [Bacteroidales bacterium]|jgi:single-strand DNA-binding protein|nr:single-stranded DNA-binding protein [Bacteroidales bacterium]